MNVVTMEGSRWAQRFIALAEHIANWSKDTTKVGCVITDRKRVISLGFNGYPTGVEDKILSREQKLMRTVHAEANALAFANTNVRGFQMYVTHPPCSHCAGHIIQRGIGTVVWKKPDPLFLDRWAASYAESLEMFTEAGVVFWQIGDKE